ncbi:MAG: U-box domain-containing protein [Gammaproteobacteria bacterium]
MLRRGPEYLADRLMARQFAAEDTKIRTRNLEEARDAALAKLLNAQIQEAPLAEQAKLQKELDQREEELKKMTGGGVGLIQAGLGIASAADKKDVADAKPVRIFTPAEMEKINKHYAALPDHLKRLMDAAMNEEISLELIAQPVFLRGDGHIYDKTATIDKLLEREDEPLYPHNQDKRFNKTTVIPCNTLILAMERLLDIINGKVKPFTSPDSRLSSLLDAGAKKRVAPELIALIEKFYATSLIDRHKMLFDIICRDPMTNNIMSDPILLPDGYIYDRTTALTYLKYMNGECPKNSAIRFTEADITPCLFVISVLDQLKQNILEAAKKAAAVPSAPPPPYPVVLHR